jgi:hypothetical protein
VCAHIGEELVEQPERRSHHTESRNRLSLCAANRHCDGSDALFHGVAHHCTTVAVHTPSEGGAGGSTNEGNRSPEPAHVTDGVRTLGHCGVRRVAVVERLDEIARLTRRTCQLGEDRGGALGERRSAGEVTSEAEQFLPGSPAARLESLGKAGGFECPQLPQGGAGRQVDEAGGVGEADAVGVLCHDTQQRKAPVGCSR